MFSIALAVLLFLHGNAFIPKYVGKDVVRVSKLSAKNEISPGVFEFRSKKPGEIPPEVAKLLSPEFVRRNNLRPNQHSNRNSNEDDEDDEDENEKRRSSRPRRLLTKRSPDKASSNSKLQGKRVGKVVKGKVDNEDEDDNLSIEDLERQLAYETGIGLKAYSDDHDDTWEQKGTKKGEVGKKGKPFETLSDQIMSDKSRFQGFGSSSFSGKTAVRRSQSSSLNRNSNQLSKDDSSDEEDDYDEDYADSPSALKKNPNRVHNPLIMKEPTKKPPVRPALQGFQKNKPEQPQKQEKYVKNNNDDDEYDDYDEEEEQQKPPSNKKNKPITTSQSKTPRKKNKFNDDDEDYDGILKAIKEKYQNKYLFDLENENQSLVDINTIHNKQHQQPDTTTQKPLKTIQSSATTTHVTPAGKNNVPKPFTIQQEHQSLPKEQYKQILNEEFYRMKKPNQTLIDLQKQKRYEKQLQKSLQQFDQYQEKLKKEKQQQHQQNNQEMILNESKYVPFTLIDSIDEFQDSLNKSSNKQLYVSNEIIFEDILFNHEIIQNEYYGADSLLNQPQGQSQLRNNQKNNQEKQPEEEINNEEEDEQSGEISSEDVMKNEKEKEKEKSVVGLRWNRYKSREFYELVRYINDNLETMKITTPTKIQEIAIPLLSIGKSTVLHAQTGSGKTLTFLLPLIYLVDPNMDKVQTIILAPSRELVTQINRVCSQLFAGTNFRSVGLIGGANIKSQIKQLREKKPQIIIATPGRLAELVFKYETISLQNVNTFIIDEADNLLQDPFQNEIKTLIEGTSFVKAKIAAAVNNEVNTNPAMMKRKYVLCLASATANNNPTVTSFMEEYSVKNDYYHPSNREEEKITPSKAIASVSTTNTKITTTKENERSYVKAIVNHAGMLPSTITHGIISCPRIKVYEMLKKFLNAKPEINRALIFVNDPYKVETVYQKLLSYGFIVAPLHGDSSKDDRKEIFTRLRDGRLRLVVTTELSARGLDIPDVTHVINFELPTDALHYVHR